MDLVGRTNRLAVLEAGVTEAEYQQAEESIARASDDDSASPITVAIVVAVVVVALVMVAAAIFIKRSAAPGGSSSAPPVTSFDNPAYATAAPITTSVGTSGVGYEEPGYAVLESEREMAHSSDISSGYMDVDGFDDGSSSDEEV
jgi:hypothetical protein